MNYQSPLSREVFQAYSHLSTIVEQMDKTHRNIENIEGTGGIVSVADIIAYQIGWGRFLLRWYQDGLNGKIPLMPGEGFSSWDYKAIARYFYQQYHYDGYSGQAKVFEQTVREILDVVENEFQSGNLDRLGVWQWCTLKSGKEWPLSKWVRVNTSAPYKRAYALIKRHPNN
ncbi:MAG: ClbS/DfsB family four-helix bundle protein [Parachlamydiales bacterium]